ncbi:MULTISPECIES: hypothetical protein [Microbacterium]|uniref:Uncharacterized protein n=1 Tax=Microbacterium saccharophilum TaxID=1213358 RepID=A0A7Z7D0Y8_9MICO|nr:MULTISPECIES: hypothetical protein [Microbacterium]GEP48105.1 hypothetical protein MSA03_16130 [Microbacterium saccharophilum]SFI71186.1 hypothetical protein SAMN04487751_2719 [Microbacterium saccharophilum]
MTTETHAVASVPAPVTAPHVGLGTGMIPRMRPIGRGGLADIMAVRRRQRRLQLTAQAA